ncbi:putative antirestriction adenine methyltransferase [Streptomyces griseus]|uniref:putative antirestriction adenine methyltransferase n=1 Tax=Streptomyces griseus TaxID=1911 RepID=UPI00374E183B
MFHGSIPSDMCRIVREHVSLWTDVTDVYNVCCGNFTVEKTLASVGKKLHSCDVLMYSTAIGRYLAGDPMPLVLTEPALAEFPWITEEHTTPEKQLATMLLCTRLAPLMGKKSNPYWDKMRRAYEQQWPDLHAKTTTKILAAAEVLKLESYACEDALTWVDKIPDGAGVVSYPPFHGAGAAFVRDFAKLEEMFEWTPPEFTIMEDPELEYLIKRITDREHWLLGTNEEVPELEPFLRGRTRTTNRGIPIYVYANSGPMRLVEPRQRTEPWPGPHLADEEIGSECTLAVLSGGQFAALRSAYMNANIRPGSESLGVAVLVDQKLVGVFAYSWAPTLGNWGAHLPQQPTVYMLSDFPVSTSRYAKLSKLIVMASISREAQLLTWRYGHRRYQSLATTAFTKRPVSMKYRGVLRLLKRDQKDVLGEAWAKGIDPTDSYYAQQYQLQYGAPFSGKPLADVLVEWKKRYGKDVKK